MAGGKFDYWPSFGRLLIAWFICERIASNNVAELAQRIVFVIAFNLLLNCNLLLFGVSLVLLVWVWYGDECVYISIV
nr:MAG TPA: hypothetical protein [Caudoviricetes sp.]